MYYLTYRIPILISCLSLLSLWVCQFLKKIHSSHVIWLSSDLIFYEPVDQHLPSTVLHYHADCQVISFSHPHVSLWVKKYTIAEDYQNFLTKATPSMSVGIRTKSLMICKCTAMKHLLDVARAQRIKKKKQAQYHLRKINDNLMLKQVKIKQYSSASWGDSTYKNTKGSIINI